MSLASRMARRARIVRTAGKLREVATRRAIDPGDPGPLLAWVPRVSPSFRSPAHLWQLAGAVERAVSGQRVRACFSIPVRHGKTSLVYHAIAWLLAKDPTRSILYASYAHKFAAKQTLKARVIAERAGVILGSTRRRDEWTTRAGGVVKAVGIGGQITGEGFTDIFVDDPHKNRAEAESRIVREGVVEAFFSDIYTRLDPRGTSYYVVHARWNLNDLIGVLSRSDPPFEVHNAPALNERGEALAPWLFSADLLSEMRDTLGPYTWASLYQGTPRPRGGALFVEPTLTDETFRATPKNFRISIGIDIARTTSTRADFNAAVVERLDIDRNLIDVLEAVRARGTVTDRMRDRELVDEGFVRQIVRIILAYPGARIVMYATESELGFVRLLERLIADALGRPITIHTMPITKDKFMRAQPYAAAWNASRVRIPGRKSVRAAHVDGDDDEGRAREGWQSGFILEHVEFTGVKGEADDQVDAAAAAYDDLSAATGTSLAEAMATVRGL